jgi:hypothetical protein
VLFVLLVSLPGVDVILVEKECSERGANAGNAE